ncbi:hypothetical protein NLG97_g2568 [Lecanicillium saksenae]|uniref:Uncharacterized protein n=1 Tax=Lecanicillium saksenae TaxID=468837 RepID=A0ACC1R0I2_9HYPO|nr:hypothetical protein NLG97_g2568 [Lecanicillium saksenae]
MAPPPKPGPSAVQEHFAKYQGDKYAEGWASLWDKGDNLPWDRGIPNPALEDLLIHQTGTIGLPMAENGERRKALVPGCGRGVDVLLLASFGEEKLGQGRIVFVQGDFFDDAWLKEIGLPRNGFDLIYDYTFFCALNPELRPKWALRHTELLASSPMGSLICLESPRHKSPLAPGPPFASPSEAYMEHLSYPGEKIPYDDAGLVHADGSREPNKNSLKRVAYWKPEWTHSVGKDENGM